MDSASIRRRSELLAAGHTRYEVDRDLRAGALSRLRRGAYLEGPAPGDGDTRHRLAIHAAFAELDAGAVASHGSAAVLHGLPTWAVPLERTQVTRVRTYGGRRDQLVHVRVARLDPDEVEYVEDIPVTTVARTVVDLARALPFQPAVAIGDGALAGGLTDAEELDDMLRRSTRRPWCASARRAVALMDGRAESVGESRSRVAIASAGLPKPQPQWEVRNAQGRLLGRGDFGWPEHGVIGEFDGRVKYGRLLRPGEDPGEAVYREKLREDDLRAEGMTVVRWTWHDLDNFHPVAARLRRALTTA
jgi:predicted transcriptional regulator of viral defense system